MRFPLWRLGVMFAFASAATWLQAATPSIQFTQLPDWGTNMPVGGQVTGLPPNAYRVLLLVYVPEEGWYSKPSCGRRQTSIRNDSTWSVSVGSPVTHRFATAFAAYLVPASYLGACLRAASEVPDAIRNASVASAIVRRRNPASQTIEFSGLAWEVKTASQPVSPGPNLFAASNVWVDDAGRLHLRVGRCGNSWCSAEVSTVEEVGYGTYRVWFDSQVAELDPNIVLGFFTWSDQSDFHNREIDVEFANWGNAASASNAQFVVQPFTLDNHIHRFLFPPHLPGIHSFVWQTGAVSFQSTAGAAIEEWSFADKQAVPPPGRAHLHLNFYLQGGLAPQDRSAHEVVISRFEYTPLGPTLALSPASMTIAQAGGSASASVIASGDGCRWSAESDVAWLRVKALPAQASVAMEADPNPGALRTGEISLYSETCSLVPGRQRIVVSQEGLLNSRQAASSTRARDR